MMATKSGAAQRREDIRLQYWPNEDAWLGDEVGWFKAPRTLPLVLSLMNEKAISGSSDPRSTYLELLSRQMGEGLVEMGHEKDHAFAAGYDSTRGVRTWNENMKILETTGFIKTQRVAGRYRYVLLIHPTALVQHLRANKKVSDEWWHAYVERKRETKEPTQEQRDKKKADGGKGAVIPIGTAVLKKARPATPKAK
jgi:hypothetical protein